MKYDLTKKMTIGAQRTLTSLQQSLLTSLTTKSFEEILVQELCEKAMLPRATFYNYFDDKYDLLEYCFMSIRHKIYREELEAESCQKQLDTLMDNFIDFFDQNMGVIQNILNHNHPNQYFINQVRFYFANSMLSVFKKNSTSHQFNIPQEIAAKFYSEAILIILEWKYLEKKECSKQQAKEYLHKMISGINLNKTN